MYRTREEWVKLLVEMELLWTHDGNPKRPHALLTAGGHSDGFFNGGKLLFGHPRLARELASDLVDMAGHVFGELEDTILVESPYMVLGPAFGAITLADKIADALDIACAFTVSTGDGESKEFKLEKRFSLQGKTVLAVEDTITTANSIRKTINVAIESGAEIAPTILAICNRSGLTEVDGRRIVAMVDKKMTNYDSKDCPLCAAGSKAIRPKEAQNWALLSAAY